MLVDHNTPAGFEAIAEAREFLLRMGRKEVAELKEGKIKAHNAAACGSHVVAPVCLPSNEAKFPFIFRLS